MRESDWQQEFLREGDCRQDHRNDLKSVRTWRSVSHPTMAKMEQNVTMI
jgi:hypothetical protein